MAFKLINLILGLIFMSVAIVVFTGFYMDMNNAYGITGDDSKSDTFKVLSNITRIVDEQEAAVQKGRTEEASLFSSITNGILDAMNVFFEYPKVFRAVINDLTGFNIPQIVVTGLITAFGVIIVFIFLRMIMKVDPQV